MATPGMDFVGGGRGGLNSLLAGGLPGGGSIQDLIAQLQGRLGGGGPPRPVKSPPMTTQPVGSGDGSRDGSGLPPGHPSYSHPRGGSPPPSFGAPPPNAIGPPGQGRAGGSPEDLDAPMSGRPVPVNQIPGGRGRDGRGAGGGGDRIRTMPFKLPEPPAPPQGAPEPPAPAPAPEPPGGTDDDFRKLAEPRAPGGPRQAPVRSPAPRRPQIARKPAPKPGGVSATPPREQEVTTLPAPAPTPPAEESPWGDLADTNFAARAQKLGFKDLSDYEGFRERRGGDNVLGRMYDQAGGGGGDAPQITIMPAPAPEPKIFRSPGLQSGPPPGGGFGLGAQMGMKAGRILPGGGVESGGFVDGKWQPNNPGGGPQVNAGNLTEVTGDLAGQMTPEKLWAIQNAPPWAQKMGAGADEVLRFIRNNPDSPIAQKYAAAGLG